MAVDAGPDGVRVNAVCPGLTITPMTEKMRGSEAVTQQYRDRVPLGRAGAADEIANAVFFLASSEASLRQRRLPGRRRRPDRLDRPAGMAAEANGLNVHRRATTLL